jgi:hypothetical protein
MRTHCRVIWGRALGKPETANIVETSHISTKYRPTESPEGSDLYLTRVFYDKEKWRQRCEALRATQTPDMIAMATIEGYDMIESL